MARVRSARERWAIASRVAAAVVGGYAFTSLCIAALALFLRVGMAMTRVDAALTATMVSFAIYAVVIITTIRARSATRAWVGLLAASVLPALVLALLYRAPQP